jgi:hypothetical protein
LGYATAHTLHDCGAATIAVPFEPQDPMTISPRLRWAAIMGGVLVVGIGAARVRKDDTPVAHEATSDTPAPVVAWCAAGLEAIPGGGCLALPPKTAPQPPPLVIYLHGRFEKSAPEEELVRQKRFAEHATARGFALLALRGKEGQCLQPELATWICWPASERSIDAGPGVVASWAPALAAAEARVGKGRRYVLGFSSGGFFATILATRAFVAADAFAIAGAGPIEPTHALGATPPLLLLSSDDDPSQPDMMLLEDELGREKWPHDTWSRAGGHDLLDGDIDAALTFFTRAAKEKLPLRPPLTTRIPRARDPNAAPHDAGAQAPEQNDEPKAAPDAEPEPPADPIE